MPWFRLLFLVAVLATTSGYRFRCYWFCTDQTGIQNDYIEQRDRCREYAQLKLDMTMRGQGTQFDDKSRKANLVSLFSECMNNNHWSVPDGRSMGAAAGAAPAPSGPLPPAAVMASHADTRNALSRTSECAFARHAAAYSTNAAARAEACDIECAQRLKAAPEAPRPAACASDVNPDMAKGFDRD